MAISQNSDWYVGVPLAIQGLRGLNSIFVSEAGHSATSVAAAFLPAALAGHPAQLCLLHRILSVYGDLTFGYEF